MSKAVFVTDNSEKCCDCVFSNPDGDYCPFHGYISMEEYSIKKPDDCPLEPMPEKKEANVLSTSPLLKGTLSEHSKGWNDCIDAIMGGMTVGKYLEMPWNIEDTIDNLEFLKKALQEKVIDINIDGIGKQDAEEVAFDFDRAIDAIKENGEYHETGLNPNQVSEMVCELSATKRILGHYQKIGTLEEVRGAAEKQKAMKPKNIGIEGYRYTDTYRCPNCGGNFTGTGIAKYCYHCGQKLDWSE